MKRTTQNIVIVVLFVLVIGLVVYCFYGKKQSPPASQAPKAEPDNIELIPPMLEQPIQNDMEIIQ